MMNSESKPPQQWRITKRLVFDFETELFNDRFKYASCLDEKRKHAPKLRLACIFDTSTGKYTYYRPQSVPRMIARLLKAEEIVSFNGKNFDLLVLRRHHRLSKRDADRLNRKHIDLCEEVEQEAGHRLSLDKLSKINLGERKHTDGRRMSSLDLAGLRVACMSDVSQTYRLFLKFVEGSLMIPENTPRSGLPARSDSPLIHSHLPDPFPYQYIDLDCDDMTEGEMAEYLAGTWGILDDGRFTFVQI